jgi:hypothetical protein
MSYAVQPTPRTSASVPRGKVIRYELVYFASLVDQIVIETRSSGLFGCGLISQESELPHCQQWRATPA